MGVRHFEAPYFLLTGYLIDGLRQTKMDCSVLEVNVGIICACSFALPALFKHLNLPGLGASFSQLKSYIFGRKADQPDPSMNEHHLSTKEARIQSKGRQSLGSDAYFA